MARQGQHHRHRVLRRRNGISRRRIDDQHARARGGLDVDIVDAGTCPADHFEAGARLDHTGVNPSFTPDDQGVIILDPGDQRGRGLAELDIDIRMLSQPAYARLGDRVGDEHAGHGLRRRGWAQTTPAPAARRPGLRLG